MLFTSTEFVLFLPIAFSLYWLVFNRLSTKASNLFLIVASYIFYGWWNWRICLLLFGITTLTFCSGHLMQCIRKRANSSDNGGGKRFYNKQLWWINFITILLCIGMLGFFKYYNFFVESLLSLASSLGFGLSIHTLNILLPLGISFYIFQSLTYTIDIYQQKIEPTKDIIAYYAFASFFPQLLSGPIGRASRLLPQYQAKREFDYSLAISGCWQILWGLFMKVCVADRLAEYVNTVYGNLELHNGTSIAIAAIFYSIQIYCDFAGYSFMAIGIGRLFGIRLDENFRQPYFANTIGDFWRRWHISLSSWFRDYVYIPLGGNRAGEARAYLNLFITFLVSGLWHGAAWSFVLWGALHGLFQILEKMRKKYLPVLGILPALRNGFGILTTFILVTIAWIFFRLTDFQEALLAVKKIFSSVGTPFSDLSTLAYGGLSLLLLIIGDFIIEKSGDKLNKVSVVIRYGVAIALALWIIGAGVFGGGQFIYFQF